MLGNALEKAISKNGFGSRDFWKCGFIVCVWAARADEKKSLMRCLFFFNEKVIWLKHRKRNSNRRLIVELQVRFKLNNSLSRRQGKWSLKVQSSEWKAFRNGPHIWKKNAFSSHSEQTTCHGYCPQGLRTANTFWCSVISGLLPWFISKQVFFFLLWFFGRFTRMT